MYKFKTSILSALNKVSVYVRSLGGKKIWGIAITGISSIALVATVFLVKYEQKVSTKAGGGPSKLYVLPNSQIVTVGQTGSFDVFLDPGGSQVSGVQFELTYDPKIVEISQSNISVGSFFNMDIAKSCGCQFSYMPNCEPQVVKSEVVSGGPNSNLAVIHFAAGYALGAKINASGNCDVPFNYASSQPGNIAHITFTAKNNGDTEISFIDSGSWGTYVFGPAPDVVNLTGQMKQSKVIVVVNQERARDIKSPLRRVIDNIPFRKE